MLLKNARLNVQNRSSSSQEMLELRRTRRSFGMRTLTKMTSRRTWTNETCSESSPNEQDKHQRTRNFWTCIDGMMSMMCLDHPFSSWALSAQVQGRPRTDTGGRSKRNLLCSFVTEATTHVSSGHRWTSTIVTIQAEGNSINSLYPHRQAQHQSWRIGIRKQQE